MRCRTLRSSPITLRRSRIRQLQPVVMKCQNAVAVVLAEPLLPSPSRNRRPRRREMKYPGQLSFPDAVGSRAPKQAPEPEAKRRRPTLRDHTGPGGRRFTRCGSGACITDPVADQLRGLLQGDKARTAFEPFYSARNYAPLWITDGKANERAQAAMAYLAGVDADGLDPADYPVPDFTSSTDPAAIAGQPEVKLSPRRPTTRTTRRWDGFIGRGLAAIFSTN